MIALQLQVKSNLSSQQATLVNYNENALDKFLVMRSQVNSTRNII